MIDRADFRQNQAAVVTAALIVFLNLLGGCSPINSRPMARESFREIASPAPSQAFSPRVTALRDGGVVLTWLEAKDDRLAALRYSVWRDGVWSGTATIAADQQFSRHPSTSPGLIALSKTNLIAYWSQKPPIEKTPTQEVDVYFAVSTDRGQHWSAPNLANRAGTGEENSYPSAAPVDETHAALVWLDGTNHKHVTLTSRLVESNGSANQAAVIDSDTCSCCPTSLVQSSSGSLLAAYRGHTPGNIRDISLLQNVQGQWSQPYIPHADNWHIAGCPVNGPQLDADGSTIALIWFSAPQDQPKVQLAFSNDGGLRFTTPIRMDEGNVIGRAQVVLLPEHSALAFWLENKTGTTRLLQRRVRMGGTMDTASEIAHGRGLGYPHCARVDKNVFVTWAEESPSSQIHVAVRE
jgi:hypothetical protein